ncbi:GIY-YIG nuclease family protein [Candidatus Babeliales bacterium]|nr:GIY-YIG nuclease family protein [Candidatus Babeliales bacterium]MBP9843496.1 GIY-YIG nuclease family protein [Candidatus Babeliales bacterium]
MITDKNFPKSAGVYFFKDANNAILYIGKAKNLKNRISSYFSSSDYKVIELLKQAVNIEFITTNNEIEALFLEAQLIKQHQPPFNRLLKAGNPYIYIFFPADKPTISIVRYKKKKGDYFGPFLTKKDALFVVEYLKKSLQLNICNKKIETGCLQFHINICAGSCKNDFDEPFYLFRLNLARQILDNQHEQAIEQISHEIEINNKNLNFERSAHLVKYQQSLQAIINTLKTLHTTKLSNLPTYAQDFDTSNQKLIDKHASNIDLLSALKNRLGLKKIPYTIDCFDISHMQSQSIVGSCVRFLNGKPDKKKFRHFGIKSLIEQNDYAALCEIVGRRYKKIEDFPDLIIIDGGKGQLNSTKHLAGPAEIISLAKREETIFFPDQEKTIVLNIHQATDRLILQIRDYAHHFAISYHRKKQKLT